MAKPAPYILHLTARPRGWGAKRFREASSKKVIKIRTADPARAMLEIGRGTGSVRINSRKYAPPSVVLPRFGPGNYENGLAMLAHLEASGIPVCNSSSSIELARDTYRTLHELQKAGLVVPLTARILSIKDLRIAIKSIPGPPWILKTFTGAMGIGTMLVHKKDQVEAIAATLWALKQPILMQEFIKSEGVGSFDTRVLIVGGKVLGAIRRSAANGEFRANIHRGGTPESLSLTKKESRLALRAAMVIGLDIAGVDWLETPDGPVFLEVNATPGFQGFESATGIDVAGAFIDFAWSLAR